MPNLKHGTLGTPDQLGAANDAADTLLPALTAMVGGDGMMMGVVGIMFQHLFEKMFSPKDRLAAFDECIAVYREEMIRRINSQMN